VLKRDELADPNSCLNRARDDEMVFVLLGRDDASPGTIRWWIKERIRLGKNTRDDAQIREAERCIRAMRNENTHQELTMQELTDRIHFVRSQRDKMMWRLSKIANMATEELRRVGPQPNSNMSQIEADALTMLDEIRGPLAKLSRVEGRG
jgi:hypothetical protein